jgi:hypothetical protein
MAPTSADAKRAKAHERQRRWGEAYREKLRERAPAEVAAREAEIREARWCATCNEVANLYIDHIMPPPKGRTHSPENLQGLCARHSAEKGGNLLPQLEAAN